MSRLSSVRGLGWPLILVCMGVATEASAQGPESTPAKARPRARQLGIEIGVLPTGPWNAITDVEGVRVGHATVRVEHEFCTGVTAILPHRGNVFQDKVPAAVVVGNGFGKLVGVTQVDELGRLESPIVLTNTLSVFRAADAVIDHVLSQPGNEQVRSVNPVVGETNDGYLNDIRRRGITSQHVEQALHNAQAGPVPEGAVGAGTGTICFGWKGGIGTASRQLPESLGRHTLGVLVQSNFGGILTVAGAPVGKELGRHFLDDLQAPAGTSRDPGGSCMIVVATDAPLDARQLKRLARRALFGLAAVGSPMTHGSGDYVIAFSTHPRSLTTEPASPLDDAALSPLFQAVREATEEAILNSLLQATTTTGYQDRTVEALPIDRLEDICRRYGVIPK